MSRQDNCELRRYNRLSISNSNFANALQAEPICCECLSCPEIVQWLCPIGNEACVTPCAAAYSQFIRSYSQLFRTSTIRLTTDLSSARLQVSPEREKPFQPSSWPNAFRKAVTAPPPPRPPLRALLGALLY